MNVRKTALTARMILLALCLLVCAAGCAAGPGGTANEEPPEQAGGAERSGSGEAVEDGLSILFIYF